MAIVMRRYQDVGEATNANLARYVSATTPPTINAQYGRVSIDINYDNAVADLVTDLDDYMSSLGLVPTATGSPKQVFQHVCTGAEGAVFTIDAAKGFVARVTNAYAVQLTLRLPAANGIKLSNIVDGALTTISFDVQLSVPAEAGDILCFTVEDLT